MLRDFALPQAVSHWAALTPDRVAIDAVETGPATWLEIHETALRWAAALLRAGIRAGDYVLTMLPNGPVAYCGWLGPSYIGAVEVPVNHANRGASLRHVIDNTRARLAIVHERFLPQWEPQFEDSSIRSVVVVGSGPVPTYGARVETASLDEFLHGAPPLAKLHEPDPMELSCIIYTSGTTGPSKGVMLAWRKWDAAYFSGYIPMRYRTADHVNYSALGLFHLTARLPLYEAARQGSRVVTRDGFKTDEWLTDIREHGVTGTILVGAMGPFIHKTPVRDDDIDNSLDYVSMAPIFEGIDDFKRRLGVTIYSAYSMTEIPFMFAVGEHYEMNDATRYTCGLPTHGPWEHRLVDDSGTEVPEGVPGELLVRGERGTVNEGYLNMAEATAAAWEGGWFHTGDLLRYDDLGRYYFVDRKKDAIRRRGENISSMEVEAEIRAHPDVADCAVFGIRSEYTEEDVMAAVVRKPGATVTHPELAGFLRARLPGFAIPRYIDFVDDLPRTVTERVQKNTLREAGVTSSTWDAQDARVQRR